MKKIIIGIGGGHYGVRRDDGKKEVYDLENIDKEIIFLTGKDKPNFLFLGHALDYSKQDKVFKDVSKIFGLKYGCWCRDLKSNEIKNEKRVDELLSWADIIFEFGGNTLDMINLWKETGFDKKLKDAYESGKVMCGISAGANCWFDGCLTDSLKEKFGDDAPLMIMDSLGIIPGIFIPHSNRETRLEDGKELLKATSNVGLFISNCAALVVQDDKVKLIKSTSDAFGKRGYWEDNKYYLSDIEENKEYFLKDLINKNIML